MPGRHRLISNPLRLGAIRWYSFQLSYQRLKIGKRIQGIGRLIDLFGLRISQPVRCQPQEFILNALYGKITAGFAMHLNNFTGQATSLIGGDGDTGRSMLGEKSVQDGVDTKLDLVGKGLNGRFLQILR